jgi:hypothetical protein
MNTHYPNLLKKFKQTCASKLIITAFWDKRGVLMVEFMEKGTTMRSALYYETLKKLCGAIQKNWRGMLTCGVVLFHENARPHTAFSTQALPDHFDWELFDHPPHSPDLSPSDYHLFSYLKIWFESQRFNSNEEFVEGVYVADLRGDRIL